MITGDTYYRWLQVRPSVYLSWWERYGTSGHTGAWTECSETLYYTDSPLRAGEKHFYPPSSGTLEISGFTFATPVYPQTGQFVQQAKDLLSTCVYIMDVLPRGKAHDLTNDVDTIGSGTIGVNARIYSMLLGTGLSETLSSTLEAAALEVSGQIQTSGAPYFYAGDGSAVSTYRFSAYGPTALLALYATGAVSGWLSSLAGAGSWEPDYSWDGTTLSGIPVDTGSYPRQITENEDYRITELYPALALASPYYSGNDDWVSQLMLDELANFTGRTSGTCYLSNGVPIDPSWEDHFGRFCTYAGHTLWNGCKVHHWVTGSLRDSLYSGLLDAATYAAGEMSGAFLSGGALYKGASKLVAAFGYLGLTGAYSIGQRALLLHAVDMEGNPREPAGQYWRPTGGPEPPSDLFIALAYGDGSWLFEFAKACEAYGTGDYGYARNLYEDPQINGGEIETLRGMIEAIYFGLTGTN